VGEKSAMRDPHGSRAAFSLSAWLSAPRLKA
jgi:hypothetical protein